VEFAPSRGAALVADGETLATLVTDSGEDSGVVRAAADLQADIERVTGRRPVHMRGAKAFGPHAIVIGTLGKSGFIDGLAQSGLIDVSAIRGQWEAHLIQVIVSPWNDRQPMVVIAGSDRRGTIFGIYALSEQIGVSPWYWWADVPVTPRKSLFVPPATRIDDKPVVQYRGIFLNDEAPALSGWAKEKFGGYNHRFYSKGLRAHPQAARQLPVAGDVAPDRLLRRRPGERPPRRRIRRRDRHLAPRADDARARGVASRGRTRGRGATRRTPSGCASSGAGASGTRASTRRS
jgi:hypothetical protein